MTVSSVGSEPTDELEDVFAQIMSLAPFWSIVIPPSFFEMAAARSSGFVFGSIPYKVRCWINLPLEIARIG